MPCQPINAVRATLPCRDMTNHCNICQLRPRQDQILTLEFTSVGDNGGAGGLKLFKRVGRHCVFVCNVDTETEIRRRVRRGGLYMRYNRQQGYSVEPYGTPLGLGHLPPTRFCVLTKCTCMYILLRNEIIVLRECEGVRRAWKGRQRRQKGPIRRKKKTRFFRYFSDVFFVAF